MTRGQRNNNPLNIRHSSSRWQGRSPVQTDACFVQFESVEYGLRAGFMLLRTYFYKYKLHTIRSIILRWAPEADGNNVFAYIRYVQMYVYNDYVRMLKEQYHYTTLTKFEESQLRSDSSPDISRCLFSNQKTPTPFCITLLKAMCEVESQFQPTDQQIKKAIALL